MLGAELRTACRLGSLLWAPTISTCQAAAGGGCVFIFRSSSGPHDPVQHHTHTHSLTHTHSHKQWDIHSNPQKGGLSRRKKQPPLSAARMETKICMLPLSVSLSLCLSVQTHCQSVGLFFLSVGPAGLWCWGLCGGGVEGGSQMFLCWSYQSAPSLFTVSTLWQTSGAHVSRVLAPARTTIKNHQSKLNESLLLLPFFLFLFFFFDSCIGGTSCSTLA